MGKWYSDPDQNMNLRVYRCKVAGTYQPLLPTRYSEGKMRPIFDTVNPLEICFYSPAEQVNIYDLGIYIEIPNIEDRKEIVTILRTYYAYIRPRFVNLPELRDYGPKVLAYAKTLEDSIIKHENFIRKEREKYEPPKELTLMDKLTKMRGLR
jgi:hypothetical protein